MIQFDSENKKVKKAIKKRKLKMQDWKFYEKFTREEWIDNLINQESHLYFFAKDDAITTAQKAAAIKLNKYLNWDELYMLAVHDLIRQFKKNLSKNRMWILDKICKNNDKIYQKIYQRLANNIKNLFDRKRKNNILNIQKNLIEEAVTKSNSNDPLSLILAEEEAKIQEKNKKNSIKNYKKMIQKITKAEKNKSGYQLLFAF